MRRTEYVRGFGILLLVAVVGLYIVKWSPYFQRTFTILNTNAYPGSSIISDKGAAPPAPSLQAAWDYAQAYFNSIWQAMVLGLLLATTVETLVPRDWIGRMLGRAGLRSSALGGLLALPAMMCTCCSAPVAVGFRKSGAAIGSSMAFFLGNPTLNPAVLVFLLLAMGWQWALLRVVFGLLLVAGAVLIATRLGRDQLVLPQPELAVSLPAEGGSLVIRWFKSLGRLVVTLVPEYIVIVLALGAFRAFLFPAAIAHAGNQPLVMVGVAIAAMLFVIPTAGEIPIIQTLQSFGLGSGLAGVLLMTLAPLSLPSLAMLSKVFPVRVLAAVAGLTVIVGLACGFVVMGLSL